MGMEEFASTVIQICSTFVLENPLKVLKMIAETEKQDDSETPKVLNKLLAKVFNNRNLPADDCRNCHHDPCLNGQYVDRNNFVVDAIIFPDNRKTEDPPLLRRILELDDDNDI